MLRKLLHEILDTGAFNLLYLLDFKINEQWERLELTIWCRSVIGTLTFWGEPGGDEDGVELLVLLRAGVAGPVTTGWAFTFSFEFLLGKLSVFVQLDKLRTILQPGKSRISRKTLPATKFCYLI